MYRWGSILFLRRSLCSCPSLHHVSFFPTYSINYLSSLVSTKLYQFSYSLSECSFFSQCSSSFYPSKMIMVDLENIHPNKSHDLMSIYSVLGTRQSMHTNSLNSYQPYMVVLLSLSFIYEVHRG